MTDTTNIPADPALIQGRRIFDATIRTAQDLIARGIEPGAVISALIGVATTISNQVAGPRETRKLLMMAADSNSDEKTV